MSEFKLDTVDKAKSVLLIWKKRQSLSESVTLADVIEAVRNCGNVMKALSYIQQDCAICARQFPASKVRKLRHCILRYLHLMVKLDFHFLKNDGG